MYDEKRIKRFKYLLGAAVLLVVAVVGFSVGNVTAKITSQPKTAANKATATKNELSRSTVEKFDLAFFTKKDLGENRNRYKGLMTEAMYNQEVSEENQPVNQAYKGMVINQALKDQNIYIDKKNMTAIVDVTYTNTQLQEPNNLKTALENQSNQATLKLTFTKQGNKYLVNDLKWIGITENGSNTSSTAPISSSSNLTSGTSSSSASTTSKTTSGGSSASSSEDNSTNDDLAASYQAW